MQRLIDEAEYVLLVLHRMRDQVSATPELFDPHAGERIDEAIVRGQELLRSLRSQLTIESLQQTSKAA